ncbi:hypothetical protein ES703_46869 [subsurface metagenome]
MIKKTEEYKEYKISLSKLNKARLKFENMQKLSEESQKISDNLSSTLGISKIGEQINFDQIDKAERQTKIKSREVKIVEKEYLDAQKELENTILDIKELRRVEAREVGKKINRKMVKIVKTIEKYIEKYRLLKKDLGQDLSERDIIDRGDITTIIGPDPTFIDFSSKMAYPTEFFLKRTKIYQSKEKEKDEIKDI